MPHARTTTAILATALLTLAGCTSTSPDSDQPAKPTTTATPSAPNTTSPADQIAACADALTAGDSQEEPECASLPPDDLLKAVQEANEQGREALESAIESAGSQ
jgi:hypothetical protein